MRRWDTRSLCAALVATGLGLTVLFVVLGAPPPGSDDAWYKGPAASLAMHGRLANPGLAGMFERAEEVSAVYPQLAQVLLGGFYAVFGVTRRVSIAWDMLIHTLGALAIATTGLRLTRGFSIEPRVAWWSALVTGVVWLAGHRVLDRLEAVGLLFVWLDLALMQQRRFTPPRAALAGIFAGLAGLCAPWAGVLGGALIVGRALSDTWTGSVRGVLLAVPAVVFGGLTTIGVFALWVAAMEWGYPGIVDEQFLGAIRTTKIYEGSGSVALTRTLALLWRNLMVEATVVPALVLSALWLPLAFKELPRAQGDAAAQARRLAIALNAAGLSAIVVGAVWRPTTYFYLWASAQLALPALTLVVARFLRSGGKVLVVGVVAVAWWSVGLTVGFHFQNDPRERLDGAHASILEIVPPGEPVAVTTTHWIAFEGRNPWVDVTSLYKFSPELISQYDWLVLGTGVGRDKPDKIMGQFELVDSVDTVAKAQVTYAWAVYRRAHPGTPRQDDTR
jgi:hypothetical protein